ncbi:MAG: helix-turn-helix domain-containing protein [Candidatus Omnitrophica bacterium]|nr:helix-turn-helix domain-containing protein [Candidatus Omnitrophota bacterium]MCM8797982.1 helix-turn-helix domain-containing protein [Candidatus Omnitrophota bacterium]
MVLKKIYFFPIISIVLVFPIDVKKEVYSLYNHSALRRIKSSSVREVEKEKLLGILGMNAGDLNLTAQALRITTAELISLIESYGLKDLYKRIEEIVTALKKNQGIVKKTAESLGVFGQTLDNEIARLYLQKTVFEIQKMADAILKAIGQTGGDLEKAAQILRIEPNRLSSEIETYGLGAEYRQLLEIIAKLKEAGGNITKATSLLGISQPTLQAKVTKYHLKPFIEELKKRGAEIIIALGRAEGDIKEAAKILGIKEDTLRQLIKDYDLQSDIDKIKTTLFALKKAKGDQGKAAEILGISKGEIASRIKDEYHLYQALADIFLNIEKIRQALGKTGGDLNKAAEVIGVEKTVFSTLISSYGLEEEVEEIRKLYNALQETNWDFTQAADKLGMDRANFVTKVDRFYLRLSRQDDEAEKILFALAEAEGDITLASQSLKTTPIELEAKIQRYGLAEKLKLIRDLVLAYKNSCGIEYKAAEALGHSGEWFRYNVGRLYLSPTLFRIDKKIEDTIEILAKGEGDFRKIAQMLKTSEREIEAMVSLYGLQEDLSNIITYVSGLKRAHGELSELARAMQSSVEGVRRGIQRYYLESFRFATAKWIEELRIVLGVNGANLESVARESNFSLSELVSLITVYNLDKEVAQIREKAFTLEQAQGNVNKTKINPKEISNFYLELYIYNIKSEIEKILYFLGKSGGVIEEAAREVGLKAEELSGLVERYNLGGDLEFIRRIVQALRQTKGNVSEAAARLSLTYHQLNYWIDHYYLNLILIAIKQQG